MFLSKPILALAVAAQSVTAIQVNVYHDGACQEYTTSYNPSSDLSCYGYNVPDTNSQIIADCGDGMVCGCIFYTEDNCQGNSNMQWLNIEFLENKCVTNGGGWKSVACSASISADQLPPILFPPI